MKKKWFQTATFKGFPFEDRADKILDKDSFKNSDFFEIEVLFIPQDLIKEYAVHSVVPHHVYISNGSENDEQLSEIIETFKGRNYWGQIGHDVVNLFSPFLDFEYLSKDSVLKRAKTGVAFGKKLNAVAHLLQNDFGEKQFISDRDCVFLFSEMCRKTGIKAKIGHIADVSNVLLNKKMISFVFTEILDNWKNHSLGDEKMFVDAVESKIVFSNKTDLNFNSKFFKAILKRPFFSFNNSRHFSGLGLFIVSLACFLGGFKWDIVIKDSVFYLTLSF
jgi:hypothetical protein